ncbi:glycoside hydrolase [Artomyces pyxidatus]|uniref:Glycoside hydrolase n=1 Tax=Artomyces pyxidatus TaxID=48021 RepID=A0ACB8T154_9AGAM|nr:glycoside hydrolase [Artomyces pyxidatus]
MRLLNLVGLIASAQGAAISARAPSGSKGVIVQMFEWTWDSIAAECTNFIGPAGYGFVQASPAQEHVTGPQWYTDYQPVSYILTSKRGNRTQYQNMINVCHAAGVKVIADTIFNHMAANDTGFGVAGSTYTHYGYPGIYQYQNFHHCGLEPNDNIKNYYNAVEVQTCQLDGLADLATETEYVRSRLAKYANDLLSLGVDGLRLDAAKHIAASDLANITSRLTPKPYLTQEVIFGYGEPITPQMYAGIGDVQEFRYTYVLKSAFLGSGSSISTLQNLDNRGWIAGSGANVFVSNHDTERNGASLNANSPSNTYILAHVFSLAHPYGTPTVLSSYSGFLNTDAGAPNNGTGTCLGNMGTNGWLCQHRSKAISGMAGFRNRVGTAALTNWVSPSSQQIAFGRGSLGFVAINNADSSWTATFSTSLPSGSYCDVVNGNSSAGVCTGSAFTVTSGKFSAIIPARSAIALHTGALGTGASNPPPPPAQPGTVPVSFSETATTVYGENIFVTGNLTQLGSWSPSNAVALSSANYPIWKVTVGLPSNTAFQYKYLRINGAKVVWESNPNRSDVTPASGSQSLNDTWR